MFCIRKSIKPVKFIKYIEGSNWQEDFVEVFGKGVLKQIKQDPWTIDGKILLLINTPFKMRTINDGDYLVKETDGYYYVYTQELFKQIYVICEPEDMEDEEN